MSCGSAEQLVVETGACLPVASSTTEQWRGEAVGESTIGWVAREFLILSIAETELSVHVGA